MHMLVKNVPWQQAGSCLQTKLVVEIQPSTVFAPQLVEYNASCKCHTHKRLMGAIGFPGALQITKWGSCQYFSYTKHSSFRVLELLKIKFTGLHALMGWWLVGDRKVIMLSILWFIWKVFALWEHISIAYWKLLVCKIKWTMSFLSKTRYPSWQ